MLFKAMNTGYDAGSKISCSGCELCVYSEQRKCSMILDYTNLFIIQNKLFFIDWILWIKSLLLLRLSGCEKSYTMVIASSGPYIQFNPKINLKLEKLQSEGFYVNKCKV